MKGTMVAPNTAWFRIVEVLSGDGKWIPFDLDDFACEEPGEYTLTLRVRAWKGRKVRLRPSPAKVEP